MEAYTLNHYRNQDGVEMVRMAVANVRKVVLFPSFPVEGRMVFPLYQDGKLGVSKIGDHQNWTIIEEDDDGKARYDDIILHKGQVYVVNKWGTIFWIDCSSFKLVQFSPVLWAFGKRKQLVESGGSLYVVDMFIEGEPDNPRGMSYEVVDIKVHKLDEEWGRWLHLKITMDAKGIASTSILKAGFGVLAWRIPGL
ncbi:F-box protein [Sesbania bispinosa]|nr:F-box protein [Sesbania bispinosa]